MDDTKKDGWDALSGQLDPELQQLVLATHAEKWRRVCDLLDLDTDEAVFAYIEKIDSHYTVCRNKSGHDDVSAWSLYWCKAWQAEAQAGEVLRGEYAQLRSRALAAVVGAGAFSFVAGALWARALLGWA